MYVRQHFLLPNTLWGRLVLWLLKRYLNRATYDVRVYGRGAIRSKLEAWDRKRWLAGQARRVDALRKQRDEGIIFPGDGEHGTLTERIEIILREPYEPPRRLSLGYPTIPLPCAARIGVYLNLKSTVRREFVAEHGRHPEA